MSVILGKPVWTGGTLTLDFVNRQVSFGPERPGVARVSRRTPRLNPAAPATAYVGGLWYDGGRFAPRDTVWAEGGVFVAHRPARVDGVLELGRAYIVPPFADAHQHDIEGPWSLPVAQTDLDAGTFYVKVVNNVARYAGWTVDRLNRPGTLDVAFSHAGITAPGAHPFPLYRRLVEQGVYRDLDADSLDGDVAFGLGTVADLEARWPDVLAQQPDHVKLLLLDHERGTGLRPEVFRRAVELARAAGLRTTVHVLTAADLALAVDAGADEAAHLPGFLHERGADAYRIPAPLADTMAARGFVVVTTTLVTANVDPPDRAAVEALQAQNIRRLLVAGVPIALGHRHLRKNRHRRGGEPAPDRGCRRRDGVPAADRNRTPSPFFQTGPLASWPPATRPASLPLPATPRLTSHVLVGFASVSSRGSRFPDPRPRPV